MEWNAQFKNEAPELLATETPGLVSVTMANEGNQGRGSGTAHNLFGGKTPCRNSHKAIEVNMHWQASALNSDLVSITSVGESGLAIALCLSHERDQCDDSKGDSPAWIIGSKSKSIETTQTLP
eukprot:6129359-Amphidinium_carterae.1